MGTVTEMLGQRCFKGLLTSAKAEQALFLKVQSCSDCTTNSGIERHQLTRHHLKRCFPPVRLPS